MREIKFRAWQQEEKKMYECVSVACARNNPWISMVVSNGYINNISNPHILMQYTGLKDKNGTEIYEGDIVKYFDEIDGTTQLFGYVQWERCWWSINLHPDYLRENDIMDIEEYIQYEVIGNIYENPDLNARIKEVLK